MSDARNARQHTLSLIGEDLRRTHQTLKARSEALCAQSQILREMTVREMAIRQEHLREMVEGRYE